MPHVEPSRPPASRRRALRLTLLVGLPLLILVILAAAGLTWADWWFCLPADARAQYVGRDECRRCHEKETALWTGSDHDLAMDHARPDTVLADFDNSEFTHYGQTTRFFRRGEKYFVSTDGPTGETQEFEVAYVFGVYPLQQYLVPFPDGRMQCLPIAWDVPGKRWFHLYPGEKIEHDDPLHWTRALQNWNYMCADCHSTNLERNFDLRTNTYHTTWSEIDVSCETCHGPGSLHVKLADEKWFFWDRQRGFALPNLKSPDNRVEIDSCAPCHARRRIVYGGAGGGARLMDHYLPELMDGALYYADGQILEEDYEYGSFTQSKMYHNKVRCSDCHDPHSLRVKFTETDPASGRPVVVDNRVCGQCHLPSKYDTVQHHHHPDQTKDGWRCVDCHMRVTPYMVVDPRRDHSMRIPRPQLTVDLGIPNACNQCHKDESKGETPQWALAKVREWYGQQTETPHFAYAIQAGRQGEPRAEKMLDAVTRRTDQSAMVRASAISLLSQYPGGWSAAVRGLEDAEPLVRATAVRCLETAPGDEVAQRLRFMLHDPLRAVRTEAVRVLVVSSPGDLVSEIREWRVDDRNAYQRALREYIEGQQALSDQPGAHVALARLYRHLGDVRRAEQAYRDALRLDKEFVPAHVNLAMLLSEIGRSQEAAAALRTTIGLAERQRAKASQLAERLPLVRKQLDEAPPDSTERGLLQSQFAALEVRAQEVRTMDTLLGEAHYSLGLLLAEEESQFPQAAEELAAAARLLPLNPRVFYNYGLVLQKLGRPGEAETQLKRAHTLVPGEFDFANALVHLYMQEGRWQDALPYAEQLSARAPGDPALSRLLQVIRQRAGAM